VSLTDSEGQFSFEVDRKFGVFNNKTNLSYEQGSPEQTNVIIGSMFPENWQSAFSQQEAIKLKEAFSFADSTYAC